MKKLFYLVGIMLITVAFASCGGGKKNTPETVVEKYLTCIQKGDADGALKLVYFKEEPSEEGMEQLKQLFDEKVKAENEQKGGIASYEITETELAEDGQSGTVKYTLTYGNGSTKDDSDKVILVDNNWKINSGK